jgi:hypothetical protein
MIAYFGEVVKMCANISYLMMTLNRYLLVGKDHAPWLVKLAKLEFKWVIRTSILFSILINIGHGWEYQAVKDLLIRLNIGRFFNHQLGGDYSIYTQANGLSYSDYPEANKDQSYFIYSIVYFCLNFGVFFILNTTVEVKIVRRMHKELQEKRERLARMNVLKTSHTEDKKNEEEEDGKKERKVIKMVVLNGVFNFIFRAPDILFWMENKTILSFVFHITKKYELGWNYFNKTRQAY